MATFVPGRHQRNLIGWRRLIRPRNLCWTCPLFCQLFGRDFWQQVEVVTSLAFAATALRKPCLRRPTFSFSWNFSFFDRSCRGRIRNCWIGHRICRRRTRGLGTGGILCRLWSIALFWRVQPILILAPWTTSLTFLGWIQWRSHLSCSMDSGIVHTRFASCCSGADAEVLPIILSICKGRVDNSYQGIWNSCTICGH